MRRAAIALALAAACGVKGPPLPPLREAEHPDAGATSPSPVPSSPPAPTSPPPSTTDAGTP